MSGPVAKAKGITRNRLKVCYWLSEWNMLRLRWEQKLGSVAHI